MENIYCRDIQTDFEYDLTVLNRIKTTVVNLEQKNHIVLTADDVDTRLVSWLKQFDAYAHYMEIFHTPANFADKGCHIDAGAQNHSSVKLNWCCSAANSKMKWWEPNPGVELGSGLSRAGTGSRYYHTPIINCRQLQEKSISTPTMVNSGVLHSIENYTNEARWCISVSISDNCTCLPINWNDAVVRFKDVVYCRDIP